MRNNLPQVWLLTDGKPGHQNQLRGLAARLAARAGATPHWVNVSRQTTRWWQLWRGADPAPDLPRPDLLVAAGSTTHPTLLATRRALGCPAVVLMRPNFPYRWCDAAIVPAHDRPPSRANVLVTQGVLNAVEPVRHVAPSRRGLLLLGGPSAHFHWHSAAIVAQVVALCAGAPDWHWTLSDSRRTPAALIEELRAMSLPNLTCVQHTATQPGWLLEQLASSGAVWVSPDSVSMLYEALTAGLPTGIFDLAAKRQGRVVQGVQSLIDGERLTPFAKRASLRAGPPIWEADRAAAWLIERFPLLQSDAHA